MILQKILAVIAFTICGAGAIRAQVPVPPQIDPQQSPPVNIPGAPAPLGQGYSQGAVGAGGVNAGRLAFITNCSFCHGSDARGGAEGGPDLTRSAIAAGAAGDSPAQQLIAFLKVGRPPRMPPFSLSDSDVLAISAFLHSQILAVIRSTGSDAAAMLVGDPKAGEAFFNGAGKCTTCHSVTGDLKGVGAKYDPQMLQGRMVLPRGHGGYPSKDFPGQPGGSQDVLRKATVTLANGQATSGDLLFISDYDVTLRDASGVWHTFARNGDSPKVVINDPLQAHLDLLAKLTDKDMHDLTAYLVTLK